MREKISFQTNVPVELALEAPGVFAEGQFGDQYRYFTCDNRIFWAPPIVETQITELEIEPGELIIICKSQVKEGRRTVTKWIVRRAQDSGTLAVQNLGRAPEGSNQPARVAAQIEPRQENAPKKPASVQIQNTISRQQRMADLLADAIAAVTDAATRTGRQLDGAQFQDLVSTMVIDQQRRDEADLRYFKAVPSTIPTGKPNGHTQWHQ